MIEDKPAKKISRPRSTAPKNPAANRTFPGAALIHHMWKRAEELGLTPAEMAEKIEALGGEMKYVSLMKLARNERQPPAIGVPTLRAIAEFLGQPTAQVMLLAEALVPDDFFLKATTEERVEKVYQAFCNDPLYGGYAPTRRVWDSADPSVRLAIAILFENATQTRWLDVAQIIKVDHNSADEKIDA